MPRITFGFPLEILELIPEFGSRMASIYQSLRSDAETYEGATPSESEFDSGIIGSEVYNFTPMNQGHLSRKILQEQGFHMLVNDTQKYVWVGDELEMTETHASGKVDIQRFRKATESLYIATTIENWYDIPVKGEFFVKTVILID